MKYLRLFENKDTEEMVENAIENYNIVGDLIRDFIKYEDPEMDIRDVYYYYYEHDLEKINDTGLIISYTDSRRRTSDEYVHLIYEDDLEKLYKFMEDPELYKATNKYNL